MFNLIESYIPEGFRKTTDIREMFDINQLPPTSVGYLYDVGKPHNNLNSTYIIKNNTVNAKLQIILLLPFYLQCDRGRLFYISPESETTFTISFNEDEVKKHGKGKYTDKMDIKILPVDFDKIVLLRRQIVPIPTPTPSSGIFPSPTPIIDPLPTPSPTPYTPSPTPTVGKTIISWSTNPSYDLIDDTSHSGYQELKEENENYSLPYREEII